MAQTPVGYFTASLHYKNLFELIVRMWEQKPYPILFFRLRKNYPLWCRHTLSACLAVSVKRRRFFLNNKTLKWEIRFFLSFFFPACRKRIDIGFLLESGRISSSNFQRTLRLIKKLVVSFPRAKIGLVSYSRKATKVFGFYRYPVIYNK